MADEEKQPQPEAEDKAAEQPEAEEPTAGDSEAKAAEATDRPRRRRRRKKADDADASAAEKAKQAAAEADAEADAAEAVGEPKAEEEDATPAEVEDEPAVAEEEPAAAEGEPADAEEKPRRRGASEVTAGRKRDPAKPPPRTADGAIAVRARAKYVRTAPRKARLVIDHIRGKPVDQARAILINTPRAASRDVLKLLDSAIANAENTHELVADELVVGQAFVDEGPTLKRYRPRALGRATRIRKRTSHMTITLTTNDTNGR
jgi:ribosomal protein L22